MKIPNRNFIITDSDIADILIAFNNADYEWILDFFEDLEPVDNIDKAKSYSFEQLIANAGIVFEKK